eukprot:461549_1
MANILNQITKHLNKKYHPIKLEISYIGKGFTGFVGRDTMNDVANKSITTFDKNDIIKYGLTVRVDIMYEHKILFDTASCPFMNKLNSNDPLQCPIYKAMKIKYKLTKENVNHLNEFSHFIDEYGQKPPCKYKDECKAFIRMESGGNKIEDQCHVKLYRHPPRTRNIKLAENMYSLIINKNKRQNHPLYKPTSDDHIKYRYNYHYKLNHLYDPFSPTGCNEYTLYDGYLNALIFEVINNGYKYDLCLQCTKDDGYRCPHNEYSILNIVDDKMECIRHKAMNKPLDRAQMLSLILYTGCDCNYGLCASQRNGNYNTWKWFDYCLYKAIKNLSICESGSFSVFSGLNGVQLDCKHVESGYFVTYVSTSWNKDIALSFMKGDGMIIKIDQEFKTHKNIYC